MKFTLRSLLGIGHLVGVHAASPSAGGRSGVGSGGGSGDGTRAARASRVGVVAAVRVGVRDDLVGHGLVLAAEQFLQADDGGQQEGDLADDEGLAGDEGDGAENQGSEESGLQQDSDQQGSKQLAGLLDWKFEWSVRKSRCQRGEIIYYVTLVYFLRCKRFTAFLT